eukprot:CAMPEP_0175139260 /NCGR_PEP_ID=MMETSP0087-20121206/10801_1 /TAXON_ID=136419 /ORGANISM="Unknown Unknown, Strain D1" /LENGTH=114 /DNA_ID=CAMNT_0016422245 /DNA_START=92 /DNA_END=436 /DNA_ORIENTATION=+
MSVFLAPSLGCAHEHKRQLALQKEEQEKEKKKTEKKKTEKKKKKAETGQPETEQSRRQLNSPQPRTCCASALLLLPSSSACPVSRSLLPLLMTKQKMTRKITIQYSAFCSAKTV